MLGDALFHEAVGPPVGVDERPNLGLESVVAVAQLGDEPLAIFGRRFDRAFEHGADAVVELLGHALASPPSSRCSQALA